MIEGAVARRRRTYRGFAEIVFSLGKLRLQVLQGRLALSLHVEPGEAERLPIETGEIRLRPGNWKVDRDLIVPTGYVLRAGAGTVLELSGPAVIVSRSPPATCRAV